MSYANYQDRNTDPEKLMRTTERPPVNAESGEPYDSTIALPDTPKSTGKGCQVHNEFVIPRGNVQKSVWFVAVAHGLVSMLQVLLETRLFHANNNIVLLRCRAAR